MKQFIDEILREVPKDGYRTRAERELQDHMETQYQTLVKAGRTPQEAQEEILRTMGEPEKLQEEYRTAWLKSLPGRMNELGRLLGTWAKGLAVMFGAEFLYAYVTGTLWNLAISLLGDSHDQQLSMMMDMEMDYHNSYLRMLLPLVFTLLVGAFYLSRRFRTSRRPTGLICAGLFAHWGIVTAFTVWVEALDDHRTFWAEAQLYLSFNAVYYTFTLMLCVLFGVLFGRLAAGKTKNKLLCNKFFYQAYQGNSI